MKTRTLIGAALLLSTTGLGMAMAAADIHSLDLFGHERHERREASAPTGAMRFAESESEHGRRHRQDDDDDNDDDAGDDDSASALPQAGPADPNAPVPNNGLFNGKARPKVEVQ